MKTILIVIVILALIGLAILWYRWNNCKNGCPPSGTVGIPCKPQKCSFWTGKPIVETPDGTTDNTSTDNSSENTSVAGKVDLLCDQGKYYKRTSTSVYGVADKVELTKAEFDALVTQGISYTGCKIGDDGSITA